MLHLISAGVLILIGIGLSLRRHHRRWHVALMSVAFSIDLGLLLYIETTRHAVDQVIHATRIMLYVHVVISVVMLGCYIVLIGLGRGLLKGIERHRMAHRNIGITFCALRMLNFVTAFLV